MASFLPADAIAAAVASAAALFFAYTRNAAASKVSKDKPESAEVLVQQRRFGTGIRNQFVLAFERFVFLNHGSYGTAPKPVLAEAQKQVLRVESFPDDFMRRRALGDYKAVCEQVAEFVKAPTGSVVLLENATTGVNAVLRSLELRSGDLMILNDNTYHACRLAVEHVADLAGCRVASFSIPLPCPSEDDLVRLFEERIAALAAAQPSGSARFVLLDHIASPTGLLFPLERLIPVCKKYADYVMVDGAHAPGMLPLDLARLGADWYTGNLHKWCFAMKGVAFLFTAPSLQAKQHPLVISHFAHSPDWQNRFFMQGTNDQSRYLSVPAALSFMRDMLGGVGAMRQYNAALSAAATDLLCGLWGTAPLLPPGLSAPFLRAIETPLEYRHFLTAHVVGGRPIDSISEEEGAALGAADSGINERVATEIFAATGIQGQFVFWVAGGRGRVYCRISSQVYNTMEDYRRLGEAVLALAARSGSGAAKPAPRAW